MLSQQRLRLRQNDVEIRWLPSKLLFKLARFNGVAFKDHTLKDPPLNWCQRCQRRLHVHFHRPLVPFIRYKGGWQGKAMLPMLVPLIRL